VTPEELRIRRVALNLTQAELAERLGLRQHHISRWESGTVAITAMRAVWLDVKLRALEQTAASA
jgi:transcriptional regulator with XRE-family HTH domain